jgi:hypothetical protein
MRHPAAWAVRFVPSLKGLDPLNNLYPALTRWANYSAALSGWVGASAVVSLPCSGNRAET